MRGKQAKEALLCQKPKTQKSKHDFNMAYWDKTHRRVLSPKCQRNEYVLLLEVLIAKTLIKSNHLY